MYIGSRTVDKMLKGADGWPLSCEEQPHVYFGEEFLLLEPDHYPRRWSIDWPGAGCNGAKQNPRYCIDCAGATCLQGRQPNALKGVIVRCTAPQRVWVLTGNYDGIGHGYEARWPD